MINDVFGRIEYDERGAGPTIVFVPGSCSTGAAWRPVIAALGARFRVVTTSLPGYGSTEERRTPIDPPMVREVEVAEQVIRRAAGLRGEPVHLIGHSCGGLVNLAVALRGRAPLASLVMIDAPAPSLLRASGDRHHYRAFREMTDRYFADYMRGEPEAIANMIDFYGGAGAFASLPPRMRDHAVATTSVNILDWTSAYEFAVTTDELQRLAVPSLVLCGAVSHPAMKRSSELLSIHLPDASIVEIRDAGHFMIRTHPAEVAAIVARHVTERIGLRSTLERIPTSASPSTGVGPRSAARR
jgi:pimeloyl-ACP methyl ester carboxylesterase